MKNTMIIILALLLGGCEVEVPQATIDDIKSEIITEEDIERIIEEQVAIRVEEIQYMLSECIDREIPGA